MLEVDHISFSYPSGDGIQNIHFSLDAGSFLSVSGPNGSGKSTLLRAIYGLFDLKDGKISVDGRKVLGPSYKHIPGDEDMRMVTQDSQVSENMSIWENLEVCHYLQTAEHIQKRNAEVLKMVGLSGMESKKPHELSGGQKQRLALARALATLPSILLLDEPFSQIDDQGRTVLTKLLKELCAEGLSIIMVTHDADLVNDLATHRLLLSEGRLERFEKV